MVQWSSPDSPFKTTIAKQEMSPGYFFLPKQVPVLQKQLARFGNVRCDAHRGTKTVQEVPNSSKQSIISQDGGRNTMPVQ